MRALQRHLGHAARVADVPLFGRRKPTLESLVAQRRQLAEELELLDADAAWTAASDDKAELAESARIRRQADAIRRSIADVDRQIASL